MKNKWDTKKKNPYSVRGIKKQKCIGCAKPAKYQFQICADGNNYRAVCADCDIKINTVVLAALNCKSLESKINAYKLFVIDDCQQEV